MRTKSSVNIICRFKKHKYYSDWEPIVLEMQVSMVGLLMLARLSNVGVAV